VIGPGGMSIHEYPHGEKGVVTVFFRGVIPKNTIGDCLKRKSFLTYSYFYVIEINETAMRCFIQ
jgi:hypothetical protein